MGDTLNASALSRLREGLRPDWSRSVTARRAMAGGLVVLAAAAALRPDPDDERTPVVIAARDLAPGIALTDGDVRVENHTATTLPDGFQSDLADVVGATLAGPVRRGELLTDVRLLSPRLAESAAGPNARIVPLHLDDAALLDLVRAGDVVDVLAAQTGAAEIDARPVVVATSAVVVTVSEKPTGARTGGDRVVLVALPAHAANEVAGAALTKSVTLTFH
jgi:Flp pilus assembly protein CpaB